MNRAWCRISGIAGACALVAVTAAAQGRPTVFMHGLGAEASDWGPTADRLKSSLAIDPHIPSLRWRSEFQRQVDDLQSNAEFRTMPDNTIAVGHSNGGVVARQWSRVHGLDGIVTIGTPHHGAPVIQHLLAWSSFNAVAPGLLNDVLRSFFISSDWWWVYFFVQETLHWVADFSIWSVVNLAGTLGAYSALPVAWDMVPGSPYLSQLNSGANLGREAAEIPNRVGIVSVARNFYFAGPARAIAPDHADAIAATMYGAAFGLMAWGNFVLMNAPLSDIGAWRQAMALLNVAGYILAVDPTYCRLVSTPDMSACLANDGLVPVNSQVFPGAPNLFIEGPAHTQEKQQSDDVLYAALTTYMHVPPRSGSSPGPVPPSPPPGPGPTPDPNPTPDPQPPPRDDDPVTITSGFLYADEWLGPEDGVTSRDGRLLFRYQRDGNLVLYDAAGDWIPLWDSSTDGSSAGFTKMQADGNLVVYDAGGTARWSSGTAGHPGAYLAVQDDGNVVVYDTDGTPLWYTWTFVH